MPGARRRPTRLSGGPESRTPAVRHRQRQPTRPGKLRQSAPRRDGRGGAVGRRSPVSASVRESPAAATLAPAWGRCYTPPDL